MTLLRTGTDNQPVGAMQHGHAPQHYASTADYGALDTPAVWRTSRDTAASHVQALQEKGVDTYDIPAFLRKQAD
jgi:cell division protein FtsZ